MRNLRNRRFANLPKGSQERLRQYVTWNRDVSSKTLSEELVLPVTTIAALKAHVTRRYY